MDDGRIEIDNNDVERRIAHGGLGPEEPHARLIRCRGRARRSLQPDRHGQTERDRSVGLLAERFVVRPRAPDQPPRRTAPVEPSYRPRLRLTPRRVTNPAFRQHGLQSTLTEIGEAEALTRQRKTLILLDHDSQVCWWIRPLHGASSGEELISPNVITGSLRTSCTIMIESQSSDHHACVNRWTSRL